MLISIKPIVQKTFIKYLINVHCGWKVNDDG